MADSVVGVWIPVVAVVVTVDGRWRSLSGARAMGSEGVAAAEVRSWGVCGREMNGGTDGRRMEGGALVWERHRHRVVALEGESHHFFLCSLLQLLDLKNLFCEKNLYSTTQVSAAPSRHVGHQGTLPLRPNGVDRQGRGQGPRSVVSGCLFRSPRGRTACDEVGG